MGLTSLPAKSILRKNMLLLGNTKIIMKGVITMIKTTIIGLVTALIISNIVSPIMITKANTSQLERNKHTITDKDYGSSGAYKARSNRINQRR